MGAKRLYLVTLILAIGCLQAGIAQEKPPVSTQNKQANEELDPQLKVNKDALLNGSVDAATVMLFHNDPKAREILLDALKQSENSPARMAVCKALIQARISKTAVKNDQDFIEPLLGLLDTQNDTEAQLAAQATLIFDYDNIIGSLDKIFKDPNKPVTTKINAVRALKLRMDMKATIRLIELVDHPDKQVADEAKNALQSLGIPVGKDTEARKKIIEQIKQEGPVAFLRAQLIRQDAQMRQERAALELWQKRYKSDLDKRYENIGDDAARGEFLATYLVDTETVVRLWALDKAYKWRVAPGSKLPEKLGPILIKLISDNDRDVRLITAELLALMPKLNSASPLLAQLEIEQDDLVKIKLLEALGGACSYAILSNPTTPISPEMKEIRKQTLEWAAKFLLEENAEKAKTGAEVIKKLLSRDGLEPKEVDRYLGLLSERYSRQKSNPDGTINLKGELLNEMAALCAQDSTYKEKATQLFEKLFIEALHDESNFVREAAVDGLTYIDKAKALKLLRNDFINDPSLILREKIIALANAAGGRDDLNWLSEKIGSNSESEPAWQAMLKIFSVSDVDLLNMWMDKLISPSSKVKLSNGQKIDFLKIAENAESNSEKKRDIQKKLAELYYETDQFDQAAEYLGILYEIASTPEAKETILPKLLDACLRGAKLESAVGLVKNYLNQGDLDPGNIVVKSINNYFSNPPAGTDPNEVLKELVAIKAPQGRPKWEQQLKNWTNYLGKAKEAEKANQQSS
jgi:HEAT repeat protein